MAANHQCKSREIISQLRTTQRQRMTTRAKHEKEDTSSLSHMTWRKGVFYLQTTLVDSEMVIPVDYFERCVYFFHKQDMADVYEERAISMHLCGYPLCHKTLAEIKRQTKFRISLSQNKMYPAEQENQFCSTKCMKRALLYLTRLTDKPAQFRPSIEKIFGMKNPTPSDFEPGAPLRRTRHDDDDVSDEKTTKMTWSKNQGQVRERLCPAVMNKRIIAREDIQIQERLETAPEQQRERAFPTKQDAIFIEGMAFPGHKMKLAKKYERALSRPNQKTQQDDVHAMIDDIQDSDDSESESESDALSSDDEEDDVDFRVEDLSPFANLWRKISSWVTLDYTRSWVRSHYDDNNDPHTGESNNSTKPSDATSIARYQAFCGLVEKRLLKIIKALNDSTRDVGPNEYEMVTALIRTFDFREAIDQLATEEWNTIALVIVLIVFRVDPEKLEHLECGANLCLILKHECYHLTLGELKHLMKIMTDLIIVETEEVEQKKVQANVDLPKTFVPTADSISSPNLRRQCRKCRRLVTKCTCKLETSSVVDTAVDLEQVFTELKFLDELD